MEKLFFKRKDGSEMLVLRTPKHTPEELVELYLSDDQEKMNYVDNYLAIKSRLAEESKPTCKRDES